MLFKKAALFTDIHFGQHQDSETHNQDCLDFIIWVSEQVKINNCDCIIFCGDWFHNRIRTEVRTAHYSRLAIEILDTIGIPIFWIIGNHDIYLRNSREIHSLSILEKYNNFIPINKITSIEDVVFSPWLVGTEQDILLSASCKYIFGHFELPLFLMNQVIEKLYDGTGLHMDDFTKCEAVYSGHFHKRQLKINKHGIPIHYIGNCFGHDFNDANDFERGLSILKYGETNTTQICWSEAPTYERYTITDILNILERNILINEKATIELIDDLGLPDDTINEIRDCINARSIRIRKTKNSELIEAILSTTKYSTPDELIEAKLKTMDYNGNYDPDLLIQIYRNC